MTDNLQNIEVDCSTGVRRLIPMTAEQIAAANYVDHAAIVAKAKVAVVEFADWAALQITGPVPAAERAGWLKKEEAARAYQAGTHSAAQLAMLSTEAGLTGEGVATLAGTIIAKADKYSQAVALISGHRRATLAAIDALGSTPTQAQIDAVLAAAKAQGVAALNQIVGG